MEIVADSIWEKVYKDKIWSKNGDSGPGSIPEMVLPWIAILNNFIRENGVTSVLDLGSGDGRIFSKIDLNKASYTGIDASSEAISLFEQNNLGKDFSLIKSDIVLKEYPKADLVIIKDVLQHNKKGDILKILDGVTKTCKYALICEDFSAEEQEDIAPGEWRPINLVKDFPEIRLNVLCFFSLPDLKYIHPKAIYLYKNDKNL
jgi:SAM-dependent methyltransferase